MWHAGRIVTASLGRVPVRGEIVPMPGWNLKSLKRTRGTPSAFAFVRTRLQL